MNLVYCISTWYSSFTLKSCPFLIKYQAQIPQICFHRARNPVKRLLSVLSNVFRWRHKKPDPDHTMLVRGVRDNFQRLYIRGDSINRDNFFTEVIGKTSRFHWKEKKFGVSWTLSLRVSRFESTINTAARVSHRSLTIIVLLRKQTKSVFLSVFVDNYLAYMKLIYCSLCKTLHFLSCFL